MFVLEFVEAFIYFSFFNGLGPVILNFSPQL